MPIVDTPSSGSAYDEWLVVRCQIGERDAFNDLVARWHPPLWRYAVRVTNDPDTAGDVVQDVWLRVVRGIAALRDAAKFRPWIFGIARRVLMDRWRARYAGPVFEAVDLTEIPETDVEDGQTEDLSVLHTELFRLPLIERDILVLFYLQELSLHEIAEVARIPLGTVKSRLFRARQLLRTQLIDKGVHP